jgi:hypothetical protein
VQIESKEAWITSSEQQVIESGFALAIETDNFPIRVQRFDLAMMRICFAVDLGTMRRYCRCGKLARYDGGQPVQAL